ncbi:MAG: hypothetical protein NVS4B13_03000 [Candidatus Elarobacter sp.]
MATLAMVALALTIAAPRAARADLERAASAGVGVARISVINGPVAVQRGDSGSATAAVINAPVLGADYVTTGEGARAEIQFDSASAVRLGANVQMRFTHLDANDRELQLAEGTIDLRLLRGVEGRSQIDTPSISVRPRASGSYRVTVDAGGTTQVTVRSGLADVVTPQGLQVLAPGTTLRAEGAAADPVVRRGVAIALDAFDRFNADRDLREERALADANAPPGVAGTDELGAYGRWVRDAGYGTVWVPAAVGSGWAPYRDGRWVWEDGYGWTWIGYEPWGWAPYHYGRWYHSGRYGWCWYPARAVVSWSPALVTFITIGFGPSGFVSDTIGWVPLAPFEPFLPWWNTGYGSTTIVNVTDVTNNFYSYAPSASNAAEITRPFARNAQDGGATAISKQRFLEGRFDHPVALKPARMRSVQVVRGPMPVVPSDANLRFSDRPVPEQIAVRATTLQGTFAGDASAVRRTPIEQQRAALAPVTRAALPVQQRSTNDPWSRFGVNRGTPGARGVTVLDGAAPAGTARAWDRFDTRHDPAALPQAPGAVREPVRGFSEPIRRTVEAPEHGATSTAPRPRYVVPVPAPPSQARGNAQPQAQANPPPARANPRSEPQGERSTTTPHQRL